MIVTDFEAINAAMQRGENAVPNYAGMQTGDMLNALKDDGLKWAYAFCQIAKEIGQPIPDVAWVHTWFATAIEYSNDVRRWKREAQTVQRLRGLVASGWCTPENSHKEMDTDLAEAIVQQLVNNIAMKEVGDE